MSHATPQVSAEQLRYHRMRQNGLLAPFATPEAAAAALVGVQAQILPAAALALGNRTTGLNEAAVDKLLHDRRSLLKLWGQRGTLHLYAADDWPLLYGARAIERTWWERQAAREHGSADARRAAHAQVAALLREHPTLGRSELRSGALGVLIEDDDLLSPWGGIFADLVRQGVACHAGRSRGEGRFAHREVWLPDLEWNPPPPHDANLTIAHRYFDAYGPSTLQDYLYWRGIARGVAAPWLKPLEQALATVDVEGTPMLLPAAQLDAITATPPPPEAWPVRMLYRFDPYILAHRDKAWVVPATHYNAVWRPAGHIEGIVLAHGRGVAVWRYDRKGRGLVIQVRPFAPLPDYVATRLPALAEDVATFLQRPLLDLEIVQPK